MIETFSSEDMLEIWRLRRGMTPCRNDCDIYRTDAADVDLLLGEEIDRWYRHLLDTAPVEMLAVGDIAPDVTARTDGDGVVTIALPDRCRRVIGVRLSGWRRDAELVTDLSSARARMQMSEFVRGGSEFPVAIVEKDRLTLYSVDPLHKTEVISLRCVTEPPAGVYILDRRALETIPSEAFADIDDSLKKQM